MSEATPGDLRKAIERADAETEEYGASNPDYGDVDVDVCRAALSAWEADIAWREMLGRALRAARPYVALYTGDPSLSNTANETWLLIGQALLEAQHEVCHREDEELEITIPAGGKAIIMECPDCGVLIPHVCAEEA